MKSRNILLTVGNGMMGDDGAGTLLAQMMQNDPSDHWAVIQGGSAPENVLHQLRDMQPQCVMIVDACDMDLPAGTIRVISEDLLQDPFLFTTHTLPLSYLIEAIREFVPQVIFLGIQPLVVAFSYPISEEVKKAVAQIAEDLRSENWQWTAYQPLT